MKISFATATGSLHLEEGTGCQDAVGAYKGKNFSLIVLSDGAGSKEYGEDSAQLIVDTVINYFKNADSDIFKSFDADNFTSQINNAFEEYGMYEESAGGTLIFVLCNAKKYLVGHMGDGVAIMQNTANLTLLSAPENGKLVNTTFFFPCSEPMRHFRFKVGNVGAPFAFIIASDGIESLLYDYEKKSIAPACKNIIDWANTYDEEKLSEILSDNIKEIFSKYTSDDISIAVMVN